MERSKQNSKLMSKYIIHKDGAKLLGLPDNLKHLSVIKAELNSEQIAILKAANIPFHPEGKTTVKLLVDEKYEKKRTEWKKFVLKGITGAGCKVAVMDTGCNTTYVPCDYTVNYTSDPDADAIGHGTQVTSIIKSSVGVAPGCEIHHIKMINDGDSVSEADFLEAINYCIANSIDVVNMSFQASFLSMQSALDSLIAANCIAIASSGNSSTDTAIAIPAGLNNCVAVNAVDEDGNPQYKNNIVSGDAVHGIDLAAAGWGNEVVTRVGTTISNYGTSFSSPFVCGMFALYKEELGIADNKKVLQHIYNKCMKQADVTNFGRGFLTA